MLSNDKINDIISEAKKKGLEVRVRDISYVLLCRHYSDKTVAYKSVWGDASEFEIRSYESSKVISYIKESVPADVFNFDPDEESESITYEENMAYMLKIKKITEEGMKDKKIPLPVAVKILADITTKLNNNFGVTDASREQLVVVPHKYNSVCPHCHHEVEAVTEPMTKEEAMEKYNLIEKEEDNE